MRPVLLVLGTRPEAVKLAPVARALRRRGLRAVVVSTGQHRELLAHTLAEVGLRPAVDLRLMRPGLPHARLSAGVLQGLIPVLRRLKPALALVQGDTTTAAAAALACLYEGVPVGHVEAGLRSFDRANPFPEEANRTVADHLSALHFAPTPTALANLRREGISGRWAMLTGNTAVDAVRWAARRAPRRDEGCLLVTLHRRESFGDPLAGMLGALVRLSERFPDTPVVFPAHPNPAVRAALRRLPRRARLRVVAPLPYRRFVGLLASCRLVLTDSGGVQEEAAALGKPVLVARDATERPELIASGGGILVGRRPRNIEREAGRLLSDGRALARMSRAKNPFGDGRAGERIAAAAARWLRSVR
ncbi:MAG: UDP-N-acetylglucosamine 2-epimerase (non-hydrolyzing) [Elusimicrobia bacterium]|nr:UDP-N-acetylglucosamine 2-epimerase (non-hydrolyzing) [Elusimicrobiota bacterium]